MLIINYLKSSFDQIMEKYHAILQVKIYQVAQLMLKREQHFFKDFGITQKQFNILRILRGTYPNSISLKEVSARMIDSSSDITRLASRLIKKELIMVSTNKADKRYKDASLSKSGMNLLTQIDKMALEKMKTGIQHLSEPECKTMNTLLDKITGDEQLTNSIIVR